MGTNYYYHEKPACRECGRDHDARHIGKSSGGWCFSLHVERPGDDGPHDLKDWLALFKTPGSVIKDEYGVEISANDMVRVITRRSPDLLRHTIGNGLCIGHGEGTWDYLVGEFS